MVTTGIHNKDKAAMLRRVVLDLEVACRHEGIGIAVCAKNMSERHAETLAAKQALLDLVGSSH
jgi:hypothetical protein